MINNVDLLSKELVKTFSFSDIHTDRNDCQDFVVDGRTYTAYGTRLATTMVGNLYKVVSDVEPVKYLLLVGVARQEKWESGISEEDAIEQAASNAQSDPVITIELSDDHMEETDFETLAWVYATSLNKKEFFATDEELKKKRFF